MRPYELVIFDWDGTLIDSTGLIVDSMQRACADLQLEVPTAQATRYIIGLGMPQALNTLLPQLPPQRYPELSQRYRYHFLSRDHETPLFAGVAALLDELREVGYRLAIATGKSRVGLNRALQFTGIGARFEATRCADESRGKPDPAMVEELMSELDVAPAQTLVVGDTTHDLDMAANAGVGAVAVSYGAHPNEELITRRPLAISHSVDELRAWLLSK